MRVNDNDVDITEIEASAIKDLEKLIGEYPTVEIEDTRVISLDISNLQLKELPQSIGNLSNLQTLNISSNQLDELPESIGKLSNLQTLNISYNQLDELPESIGNLSNLQTLYISYNQLKELPEFIGNLSNLQTLNIPSNQLDELPESIGKLSNLQTLSISYNQLKELPESIGNLSNLQRLNISYNQLKELPESIGNLSNLQTLVMFNIHLKELPESIGNLSNLQMLDISNNQLKELPESIGNLSNLQTLDINKNYISTFPDSILKMENIKVQLEKSFNFLLALNYFPKKYSVKEGDTKEKINKKDRSNITVQKHLFSKLAKSTMKSYYWNFITGFSEWISFIFRISQWKFSLYQINSSTDKKQRELIDLKEGENTKHLDHPNRKNNFIELQMVIELEIPPIYSSMFQDLTQQFIFLTPLIRSITLTAETDRGDSIPLVFTDFYFMWNKETQENEFQKTLMLKFDPGYAIEPFVRIDFTDVKVEYESTLLPDSHRESPELAVLRSEIGRINKNFDFIREFIEKKENFKFPSDKELKTYEERENSDLKIKESKEIFEAFENAWREPILPTVILEIGRRAGKVGKKWGSWLGKYADYLAAGVIVAGVIPSLLQFLYKFFASIGKWGLIDWVTWDLNQISVPAIFEILTYSPLFILFVYLTIKFLLRQRIPKE